MGKAIKTNKISKKKKNKKSLIQQLVSNIKEKYPSATDIEMRYIGRIPVGMNFRTEEGGEVKQTKFIVS